MESVIIKRWRPQKLSMEPAPSAGAGLSESPTDRASGGESSLVTLPRPRITVNTKLGSRSSMSRLRHMYTMPPSLCADVAFGDRSQNAAT